MNRGRVVWMVLASLAGGCTKYAYYGYQYRFNQEFVGEEPEMIPVEARQLLASAKTVAFFPPDFCINTDTQISGDRKRVEQLRASCGVLLSTLERAAEGAGYEVLSWQNLRGTRRAIEYAREANVDVLFEINQFDLGPLTDKDVEGGLAFFERDDGVDEPIQVPHGEACLAYAQKAQPTQEVAVTGTIDIKTVSVIDGRNRWRYRKSLTKPRAVEYERVAFGSVPKPNPGGVALGVIGALGLGVGLGLFLGDYTTSDDPATPENEDISFGSVPEILIVTGGIAFIGSFVVNALTSNGGSPDRMCAADSTVEPLVTPGRMLQIDEEVENAAIRSEMIGEFVDVIVDVRNSMPASPPPAEPAPPTPAP